MLAQLYLAITLAPVIAEVHGSSGRAAAAAVGTTYALAYGLGFLIFGPLSDRYGRKPILVPGMAVLAVATAGLAAASSLPMVAVLRAIQGLLAASFATVGFGVRGRGPSAALAFHRDRRDVDRLPVGRHSSARSMRRRSRRALGWRWVFGLAAPAFVIAAIAMAMILLEPPRSGSPVSLGQKYKELGALAVRRELTLLNAAAFPVLLSFVAMYAALGPLLQTQFGLDQGGVLLVRLAGLPAMLLGTARRLARRTLRRRPGSPSQATLIAAAGLAAEGLSVFAPWALVISSVVFVLGIATIVPSVIALVGSRGGSSRAGALAVNGVAVFAGASCGPLVAQLPIGFTGLMLLLAALLMIAAATRRDQQYGERSTSPSRTCGQAAGRRQLGGDRSWFRL